MKHRHPSTRQLETVEKKKSSVFERNTLRESFLQRWGVGAVDEGIVSGGAVGGKRFGALCLGEGRE
jgi:hypothetical protein